MRSSLQLQVGQHLTMTPRLQQAIRLLQLSSSELQVEIQDALDSNMMLELNEDDTDGRTNDEDLRPETEQGVQESYSLTTETDRSQDVIPDDLPVDSAWDDVFDSLSHYTKSVDNHDYDSFENNHSREQTLREYLEWQLNLIPISDTDKTIAMAIIDSLDDDGYLTETLESILVAVGIDDKNNEIGIEEVEAVLHMIHNLDPPGVGSRNIKECLSIQLKQCDPNTPRLQEAKILVNDYLDLLAAYNYTQLMCKIKLDQKELSEVIALIQSMNPRPGNQIQEKRTEYIIPDIYVKKEKGIWKVELNTEVFPNLRINSAYASMVKRADNSKDNHSLKTHLQEARWFIKSLRSRSETVLQVATCIVERQRAFLEYGEEAMKSLVLHDIAEELNMHESTISRATTRKYMHTPRGIFELKYFFSSHINTNHGGVCSSIAVRSLIRKLINAEKPNKPLSDSKIADILQEQGINIARRTVAKYREAMALPPSNKRKRLA